MLPRAVNEMPSEVMVTVSGSNHSYVWLAPSISSPTVRAAFVGP